MKISLKNSTLNRLLPAALAITIAAAVVAKPGPHRHGTDILHLSIRKAMSNEGVLADAAGQISLKDNVQGNANHQELDIIVKGLETNSTYQLLALVNDDTNLTQVSSFDTDAAGKAALLYWQFGNGHGLGHGRTALPAALNPVSLVRAISIYNDSTQAVLSADLSSADSLQYLMKRDLSTDSVEASLRIKATTSQTQFRPIDGKVMRKENDNERKSDFN